jgi:pyruvate formate lyase activating enzyme
MALDTLGLVKTTLVDFPGKVAATLFTYGCNLRCPYCHNANLVVGGIPPDFVSRDEVLRFLSRRRRVLEGVVITGGEPLLHADLPELIADIRALDLAVKVDTNGLLPTRLDGLDADYVALDLKLAPERYGELGFNGGGTESPVGNSDAPADRLRNSLAVLRAGATAGRWSYELRTTVVPGLVEDRDIRAIGKLLTPGERLVLAPFRGGQTLDPRYAETAPPTPTVLQQFAETLRHSGAEIVVREV